ncbi:MAG: hypothetical protein PHW69_05330 [Elusimicrobiaceae bacterium]|nr:hypothetical protein [Elusimicrobiaceae bacterium]
MSFWRRHGAVSVRLAAWFGWLLALSALAVPMQNPDFFWHLSAGKYMAELWRFPVSDFLSWTRNGSPWVDFEWLFQLAAYLLYSSTGYWGVFAMRALMLGGVFFVFWRHLKLYGLQSFGFVLLPCLAVAFPSVDIRPDNITVLLFSLWFYWLEKFRLGALGWSARRMMSAAFFTFLVWANWHAGFCYGLFLLVIYTLDAFYERFKVRGRPEPKNGPGPERILPAVLLAAVAGTLLNPYGVKIYAVVLEHNALGAMLAQHISEWRQSSIYFPSQRPYWVIMAVALTAFAIRTLKFSHMRLAHALGLGYFAVASVMHARHSIFMVLFGLPLAADYCRELAAALKLRKMVCAAAGVLLLAVLGRFAGFVWPQFRAPVWFRAAEADGPCRFLQANKAELAGLRMFNPWEWGGYMGYRLYPDYLVFQDGRYIFHDFLQPLSQNYSNPVKWRQFLGREGIELLVMKMQHDEQALPHKGRIVLVPTYMLFVSRKDWAVVYWDMAGVVFVRRTGVSPDWLKEHEFPQLWPDSFRLLGMKMLEGKIRPENLRTEAERYEKQMAALGLAARPAPQAVKNWFSGVSAAFPQ